MARPKKEKVEDTKKKSNERKTRLTEVMKEINKTHGTIIKFGCDEKPKEYLSFGVQEVDEFAGGITKGNFTVVYGPESSGKSTLGLHTVAKAQRAGLICCYIDLEHSLDIDRAVEIGVDIDSLVIIEEADSAEQAMDITIKLSKEGVVDLIIIDSIQAMSPKGEQETKAGKQKSIEDDTMAALARKLGQFFRMCATPVYKGQVAVLLVGQVRTMGIGSFATHDGLSGGKALLHWAYQVIYMRRGQKADAPMTKVKEPYIDEETGEEKTRTVNLAIGFDCVMKLEKTKSSKSKGEGTVLHLPFYLESGFIVPPVPEPKKDEVNETGTAGSTSSQ